MLLRLLMFQRRTGGSPGLAAMATSVGLASPLTTRTHQVVVVPLVTILRGPRGKALALATACLQRTASAPRCHPVRLG